MRHSFLVSLALAGLIFSGCAGGSGNIPNLGGGSGSGGSGGSGSGGSGSGGGNNSSARNKVTLFVHVPKSASTPSRSSRRSAQARLHPNWVSPSSDTIVLDVASVNGTPGTQSETQYQSLSTGTNCTADPSGNGIDCTVVMNNVPVGNDFFRITTTDSTESATAPAGIQPTAADGVTLLGPSLSQNFVAATVVNTAASNCDSGAGPIVNCVGVTLDAVVAHGVGPSVNSGATTMPAGAPATQGYYVYVGFSDYDNNLIYGGGGGNGNVGDTAVYTSVAAGLANSPQGEELDTLFVSSSAQPIILTDYGTDAILGSGSPVSTTRINYNEYIVPTSGASTTVCAWDTPAGLLGTSSTQCASTTYSPPSAPITIIVN
jgi:hypothetical protein